MSSKTIVVGYDGTDGSKAALEEAITVAQEIGGEILAVFAYDRVIVGGESHDLDAQVHARGDAMLAEARGHRDGGRGHAAQGVHRGERGRAPSSRSPTTWTRASSSSAPTASAR